MPRHTRNEIKAGAFMVIGFILLCAGIFIIGDFETLFRAKATHYFSFDNVQGLKVGDDVLYAGIKCGSVVNIEYEDAGVPSSIGEASTRVLVTIEMDSRTPLKTKDRPMVSKGFTGSIQMDIVPYKRTSAQDVLGEPLVTSRDKPLRGFHYPSIEEISEQARGILAQVDAELDKARGMLENLKDASEGVKKVVQTTENLITRNEQKVDTIVANAEKIAANVESMTAEAKPEVLGTIADARGTVTEARETITKTRKKIEDELLPKISQMMDKLNEASVDAREATAEARTASREVREIVVGNRPNIDGTIDEMRQAAARLNLGMEDIRRNPWKLLSRNVEADAYTQNIYDASMSFAAGARALSHASANLEGLLSRPETDQAVVKETTEKINTLLAQMAELEKLLYEALKKRPR